MADTADLIVVGKQVYVSTEGVLRPATLFVKNGKVLKIAAYDDELKGDNVMRVPDEHWLLPGLVDSHVHVNEPGRTDWEGFTTATRAAVKGGVTTIADMPLNSIPPTTTVENFDVKKKAAHGQCWTDMRFIGGFINDNTQHLPSLVEAGVCGFKCFLIHSGVDEFPHVSIKQVQHALKALSKRKSFLMFHAEMDADADAELEEEHKHDHDHDAGSGAPPSPKKRRTGQHTSEPTGSTDTETKQQQDGHSGGHTTGSGSSEAHKRTFSEVANEIQQEVKADPTKYQTFLESRPKTMENKAIAAVIEACRRQGDVRCHIVHLSSAEALPLIRKAKKEGLPLSVETCFHYLFFNAEKLPDAQPRFKCCPPIREDANRDALWEAVMDGTIDMVVSDHSPCTENLKKMDNLMNAWGGISGLQFGLCVMHTEGSKRRVPLSRVVQCLCENTAQLIGVGHRKGRIQEGFDADFIVFDPTAEMTVRKADLWYKNKLSAYEGAHMRGAVKRTILRGHTVFADGEIVGNARGEYL